MRTSTKNLNTHSKRAFKNHLPNTFCFIKTIENNFDYNFKNTTLTKNNAKPHSFHWTHRKKKAGKRL